MPDQKPRIAALRIGLLTACAWTAGLVGAAHALDTLDFNVATSDPALRDSLRAASQTAQAAAQDGASDRDIFAATLTDYRILTEALYANGYYGGVIRISVDGREAARMDVLDAPSRIGRIRISVDPGRPFTFGRFTVSPRPPAPHDADVPTLTPGEPARSTDVRATVQATIDGWRAASHAKAKVASQSAVADHARATLSGDVRIAPGPSVTFGRLILTNDSAVREGRIRKIAGLPMGEKFSPDTLERVARRLRRTGAFASVSVGEAETLGPGNTMNIPLTLVDAKPRRFGVGAEVSNFEGLGLSGYWLHRNLFGGAERFRVEASADNIGGQTSGPDYRLGARLTIPATLGPDTNYYVMGEVEHLDEPAFTSDILRLGFGATRYFGDDLEVEAGVEYLAAMTSDDLGDRRFTLLNLPLKLTLDRRDNALDATDGYYLQTKLTPYAGFKGSASGLQGTLDARAYRGFGADDRVVLAGRVQLGTVIGSGLTETHPDYLFYSGGGGTVRGQPYQSLNVDLGGGQTSGGRSFAAISAELRARVNDSFGAVAFFDTGFVGRDSLVGGSGTWHSGAGVGLRYLTPLGPIRFDVAAPVSGTTGKGLQLYLGIGQSF